MVKQPQQAEDNIQQKNFMIHRLYLKDLSFEAPECPQIFQQDWQPEMSFDLNSHHHKISEDAYEVMLHATLTTKLHDKIAYIIEAQYAGIFSIRDRTDDQLEPLLRSYCPTILYPYLREVFFDVVNRGSFPQIHIAPVNFDALYAQYLAEQALAVNETSTDKVN